MNEWSFFCANGGNQCWQVWGRFREKTKMAESKMWNLHKKNLLKLCRIQVGRIQDGCHHQVRWEWMSLSQIELVWVKVRLECFSPHTHSQSVFEWIWEMITRCLNPRQNSRWLPSSSWIRMNEWSFFCANGGNQCWQVWGRFREKTKMAESKMWNSSWQNSRWLPSSS